MLPDARRTLGPSLLSCLLLYVHARGSTGLVWFAIAPLKDPREYNVSAGCQGLFWAQRHVSK